MIHTVVNALAIVSGIVCDGAKASCAAKIASSIEAGSLDTACTVMDSSSLMGMALSQRRRGYAEKRWQIGEKRNEGDQRGNH